MSVTDTLGDMLTRIRNGQMAGMPVVTCPSSKLRKNVLEALQREGYIRGYTEVQHGGAQAELEIELKYHEGERRHPQDRARFDPGPPRLCRHQGSGPRVQRSRRFDPVDAARRAFG